MSETRGGEKPHLGGTGPIHEDWPNLDLWGEHPDPFVLNALAGVEGIGPAVYPQNDEEYLLAMREKMVKKEIIETLDDLKERTGFQPIDKKTSVVKGLVNFITTNAKSGESRDYDSRIREAVERTGKDSAATFGLANFDGQESVMYLLDWEFIGGTLGASEGQKFIDAVEEAKKRELPLVIAGSSGGARQEENIFALMQMIRGVSSLSRLSKEKGVPTVALLIGNVYGGVSASTFPMADVVVGVKDGDFGFAGSDVITAYEGQKPPPGSQSVESNYLRRNVDVLVDKSEIYDYVSTYLRVVDTSKKVRKSKLDNKEKAARWDEMHADDRLRVIKLRKDGFSPALFKNQKKLRAGLKVEFPDPMPVDVESIEPDNLYENYRKIIQDVGRPDTEFLLKTVFDDVVPLYNHYTRGNRIEYPPIITAYAKLEGQSFLVVGNQISYMVLESGKIIPKLSTPTPDDYERVKEQMDIAARRGIPVISFVNTLGARPTLEDEQNGQAKKISKCIEAFNSHPALVMTVVTGGLGSGGGIAITASSPKLFLLDYAQIWVAEPKSGTAIVQKTSKPTEEQIKEFMSEFKCSAKEIKELGLPVHVIKTGKTAHQTARSIAHTLREAYAQQRNLSPRRAIELRDWVIDKMILNHLEQVERTQPETE